MIQGWRGSNAKGAVKSGLRHMRRVENSTEARGSVQTTVKPNAKTTEWIFPFCRFDHILIFINFV